MYILLLTSGKLADDDEVWCGVIVVVDAGVDPVVGVSIAAATVVAASGVWTGTTDGTVADDCMAGRVVLMALGLELHCFCSELGIR